MRFILAFLVSLMFTTGTASCTVRAIEVDPRAWAGYLLAACVLGAYCLAAALTWMFGPDLDVDWLDKADNNENKGKTR